MIFIILVDILYCENVDHKAKADWPGFVLSETVDDLALVVSILC